MDKILKLYKITIILIIINSLMYASIISLDSHAFYHYDNDHCHICMIIDLAKIITSTVIGAFVSNLFFFLVKRIIFNIERKRNIFIKKSLILQKVQFNE